MRTITFSDGSKVTVDDKVANLIIELLKKNRGTPIGVEAFIARFKQKYVYCDLVRIGGEGDGGYLLPDIMNKVRYCFSPGVSDVVLLSRNFLKSTTLSHLWRMPP